MFSRLSLRPLDCPHLFACVFGVKIIEQVTERGKIVVAFCTVYPVIDCDISHVTFYEKDFRIVADFQIIAPPNLDISLTMTVATFPASISAIILLKFGLSNNEV